MSRPLTRAQTLENRAFLNLLRRTGNVRLVCREVGLKYGTMQHRRRVHPAFALRWEAAVAFAQARFEAVGRVGPSVGRPSCSPLRPTRYKTKSAVGPSTSCAGSPPSAGIPLNVIVQRSLEARSAHRSAAGRNGSFRTAGGEPHLVRTRDGRLQMRRAQVGKITREAEQAFLAAVAATCNVSLAAAAVGACFGAFNRRRRKDPAFARELRMALARGWEQLEMGLFESGLPGSHEHSDWRHNDPPALPPMSVNQALQLLYLHQKEARLLSEPEHLKRRRGESREAHGERLAQMAEERDRRAREAFEVAEAERWAAGLPAWGPAGEEVRARLGLGGLGVPDLAQVTGWSRADATKAPHHADRALFGGWRMEEMEAKLEGE
jgi:hypothetical protein